MKVVHLTSVHRPFDPRIFHKECRSLADAGHEVVLICCHTQNDKVDGVRIRPVPIPKTRTERLTRTAWAIWRSALAEDADIYHFHDPELLPIGILLKSMTGSKVVYDIHEDLPRQISTKTWIPALLRPGLARISEVSEQVGARIVDGIVAATPKIADRFPNARTVTVQNFPIPGELQPDSPVDYPPRPNDFVYVGALSRTRGLMEIIDAIAMLPDAYDAKLHLAGDFSFSTPNAQGSGTVAHKRKLLEEYTGRPGWKRVVFHGWVDRPTVSRLLASSRAGLVTLHPVRNYRDAYPVKLFEYMAAGIPAIASDFPLWREIVEGAGCGVMVDPLDPGSIASAMQDLLERPEKAGQMGRRGRQAVLEQYNWTTEAGKLLDLYRDLAC